MPRFVFDTDAVSGAQLDAAVRLAHLRFPEIAIESLRGARRDDADRVRWVCEAPSLSHIDRWIASTGLAVDTFGPTEPKEGS